MSPLTIIGKTAGLMEIVAASMDGVNVGVSPLHGAGIAQFALAGYLIEEAGKQELIEPQAQPPGQGYQSGGFRAAPEHQIVVVTFEDPGWGVLDFSRGTRPAPATLFAMAVACKANANFIMQQAIMQGAMANAQAQAIANGVRPS